MKSDINNFSLAIFMCLSKCKDWFTYTNIFRYLRDNLKFIDKDRIGVWGWSYGGFASAMILAQDKEVFRCGISVAPVTSWAHYGNNFHICFYAFLLFFLTKHFVCSETIM